MQNYVYPSSSNVTLTGSTNNTPIPPTSIVVGGENASGNTEPLQLDSSGNLKVAIATGISNPLPVTDAAAEASLSSIDTKLSSQATAANQATGNASLSSIDTKLSSQATAANQTSLNSLITARLTGSLVPTAFDEVDLTYVTVGNGIGQIQTAVYKLATVTVKTLTLSYDGSDRLSTVVAS